MNKAQLLKIEDEVVESMINSGAKETTKRMFGELRDGSSRTPSLIKHIRYYIRLGYSDIQTDDTLKDLYDYRLYLERNGDKNENESTLTESKKR